MNKRLRDSRIFKYIPTQDSIRNIHFLKPLHRHLDHHLLWQFNRRSVAGGTAIGLFFALAVPFGQIPLSALFAILFRVNLPIAVFGTFLSNPFTTPAFLYCSYLTGAYLVGHELPAQLTLAGPAVPTPSEGFFAGLIEWVMQTVVWVQSAGAPLVVGLGVLSVAFAVCGYFGVNWIWHMQVALRWRARRLQRRLAKNRSC